MGKLRSHSSKEVADLAKEVVKKWKNDVEREKQQQVGAGGKNPPPAMTKAPRMSHGNTYTLDNVTDFETYLQRLARPPSLSQTGLRRP